MPEPAEDIAVAGPPLRVGRTGGPHARRSQRMCIFREGVDGPADGPWLGWGDSGMWLRIGLATLLAMPVWGMAALAGAQGDPDCGAWLDNGYWRVATGADVRRCLRRGGVDVDARDRHGRTALHMAVRYGSTVAVRALLGAGAEVDVRDEDGGTALHAAVALGSTATVRALLDGGADVDTRTKDGETALHAAVALGSTGTVQTLLAAGADANARMKNGVTALHLAAALGAVERVRLLLDAGAYMEARATRQRLPFHFAETGRRMVEEIQDGMSGRKGRRPGRDRGRRDSIGACREAEKLFDLLDSPSPEPREACRMLATVSRFSDLLQFRWDLSGRPYWDLLRALGGERQAMDGLRESYREAKDLLQVSGDR